MFASYNPNQQLDDGAQPVLQAVVAGRAARRLPGPDHVVLRPHRRGADHGDPERPGRLDARGAAGRPARRARHEVREAGARQPADGVLVRADEHAAGAVQQPEGAAGGELRDRPQRAGEALRRAEPRDPVVPGPAGRASRATRTTARTRRTRARSGRRPTSRRRSSSSRSRARRARRSSSSSPDDEVNKAIGVYLAERAQRRSATRRASSRSPGTSSSPTCRTRRTRCRSTCSSGTRTTRLRRTSSTSCSAASRSTRAATRASTSPGFCNKPINDQMHKALDARA